MLRLFLAPSARGRGEIGRRSGLKIRFPAGSAGSNPAARTITALTALLLAATSCRDRAPDPAVAVSVIGGGFRAGAPERGDLSSAARLFLQETAVGLVTLDAAGQIKAGIAESWILTDDGLSLIFRLQPLHWADGAPVTAAQVAALLNRQLARNSRNRLKPLLSTVAAIVGMTGRVIEVRLRAPRPNLLQLLAQPEFSLLRGRTGLGPWRAVDAADGAVELLPVQRRTDEDASLAPDSGVERVTVHAEPTPAAVARFIRGRSALVLGGTARDWPVAALGRPNTGLRFDPADGLFGLGLRPTTPFLRDAAMREALAMAVDRAALVAAVAAPRWGVRERLLPDRLDSAAPPTTPRWALVQLPERRRVARERVADWTRRNGEIAPLRILLPAGPGMRLIFTRLLLDFRAIGLDLVPAASAAGADLVLVDEVAPNASANWYLTRTSCEAGFACAPETEAALLASRAAPTLAERARLIAEADRAAAAAPAFIPLASPLRWSLVAPSLTGFRENAFAAHPLSELRPRLY